MTVTVVESDAVWMDVISLPLAVPTFAQVMVVVDVVKWKDAQNPRSLLPASV